MLEFHLIFQFSILKYLYISYVGMLAGLMLWFNMIWISGNNPPPRPFMESRFQSDPSLGNASHMSTAQGSRANLLTNQQHRPCVDPRMGFPRAPSFVSGSVAPYSSPDPANQVAIELFFEAWHCINFVFICGIQRWRNLKLGIIFILIYLIIEHSGFVCDWKLILLTY